MIAVGGVVPPQDYGLTRASMRMRRSWTLTQTRKRGRRMDCRVSPAMTVTANPNPPEMKISADLERAATEKDAMGQKATWMDLEPMSAKCQQQTCPVWRFAGSGVSVQPDLDRSRTSSDKPSLFEALFNPLCVGGVGKWQSRQVVGVGVFRIERFQLGPDALGLVNLAEMPECRNQQAAR